MLTGLSTQILVADADPFRLAIYEQHLRNLGYTNINAVAVDENKNDFNNHNGIIFIDMCVAAENTCSVIQNIKQINPDNYVVLITSREKMLLAEEALKFGAFDLVIKGEYLFATISEVLENIRLAQKQFDSNVDEFELPEKPLYLHPDGSINSFCW